MKEMKMRRLICTGGLLSHMLWRITGVKERLWMARIAIWS
jgi:hypothetical protein